MHTGVDVRDAAAGIDGARGQRRPGIVGHTACCGDCRVLLCFPCPPGSHPSFALRNRMVCVPGRAERDG
jgi:hypothetical protein